MQKKKEPLPSCMQSQKDIETISQKPNRDENDRFDFVSASQPINHYRDI